MAKRRRTQPAATGKTHGVINGAGEVVEQNIDSTIRENYMPYAMSVILSRLFRRLTDLNRRTESCFIQCIKWDF